MPNATLLLTVSYVQYNRGRRIQPQREPHARVAPDMFWLLLPTTVLSGSNVGAHNIGKCEARAVIVVCNTRASWFPMIEGAGVRLVQIAPKGQNSQFFRVDHQRGAEPYRFGQRGIRLV